MLFKEMLFLIISLEVLAIAAFTLGYLLGINKCRKEKKTESPKVNKIDLPENYLEPITPKQQQFIKDLEKEETKNVRKEDED